MILFYKLRLTPNKAFNESYIDSLLRNKFQKNKSTLFSYVLIKRSVDARKRKPVYVLNFKLFIAQEPEVTEFKVSYKNVDENKTAVIIGAGPAGLFAALKLIEAGIKPIIIERGKDVKSRRKDLAEISKNHIVNPDSNYCFGEGGAGTYSDGKLFTRSKKKGNVLEMLKLLVHFGAPESILVDAHPHIGTNKLPQLITNIRKTILNYGGEILFNERVVDFTIDGNRISSVKTQNGKEFSTDDIILATGHSASDIYRLLDNKGIALEQKSFAIGVRIEHPQQLIDQIQYNCEVRDENLPPATFSIINQAVGRSVYSFCMCPGGVIAPCATAPGEIVTNGWSPSKRNNHFANSGIVVNVTEEDTKPFEKHGALAGLYFRESIEKKAWIAGGKSQTAPAQRLVDFLNNKKSTDLPETSYFPGIKSAEMTMIFPRMIITALKKSFNKWSKSIPGFVNNDAIIVAVESRTSSPVRIPRDKYSLAHIEINNLYPSGEGAGYAGGIISAAIDGERCAEKIISKRL